MTRQIAAHIARTQFGQIMERAVQNDERFVVDRRGEPAVVIMSVASYLKNVAPEDKALKAIRDNAKRAGLDKLSMNDINKEIASYRREKHRQAA